MTSEARGSASVTLAYRSLVIRVASADPVPLRWLVEFVTPAFAIADAGARADRAVTLALDPARFAALDATGRPAAVEEVDCFTLDGESARWPSWPDSSGGRVIRDGWAPVFLLVAGRTGDVTVLAARDGPRVRVALMRVVRELATARAQRSGDLPLHAAAVEVGGRAVAFAGPRRSGKSTLLLHALSSGGARLVTNDRLFVEVAGDPPPARAMPTIVSLREGSLERFPALAARREASGFVFHRTAAEPVPPGEPAPSDASGRPAASGRGTTGLSPSQLCALTGVGATGVAPLCAIVFPEVSEATPAFELRPLSHAEAATRLRASLLLACMPERTASAFDGPEGAWSRDDAALGALCRALSGRVPCLAARLGAGAYGAPEGDGGAAGAATVWSAIRDRL